MRVDRIDVLLMQLVSSIMDTIATTIKTTHICSTSKIGHIDNSFEDHAKSFPTWILVN